MSNEKTVQEILKTIEYSVGDHIRDDEFFIVILNENGDLVREFHHYDYENAYKFFDSLLTPEQLEAVRIDQENTDQEILEWQSNRELGYQP